MAFELLRTDYVDAVFEGLRKYMIGDNGDGTVSFIDVTNYTVREGSFFGAKDANAINTAVNAILAALNNGTNLYDVFTMFFETQKTLFEEESDAKQAGFEQYIAELRTYMDGKWDELKDEYTGDIQYFKDVQKNAFNVWFQMVRDQLTNDVAGHLQTQIGNLQELTTNNSSNLVEAVNEVNELAAGNEEKIGALDALETNEKGNIVKAINEVKGVSGVSGVKGNKETAYRTGEVNLTPENIGALPDGTVPISKGGTGKTTAASGFASLANGLSKSGASAAGPLNGGFLFPLRHDSVSTDTYLLTSLEQLWNYYLKNKIAEGGVAATAKALAKVSHINGIPFNGSLDETNFFEFSGTAKSIANVDGKVIDVTIDGFYVSKGAVLRIFFAQKQPTYRYNIRVNSGTCYTIVDGITNNTDVYFNRNQVYTFVFTGVSWKCASSMFEEKQLLYSVMGQSSSAAVEIPLDMGRMSNAVLLVIGHGRAISSTYSYPDYYKVSAIFYNSYSEDGTSARHGKEIVLSTAGSTVRFTLTIGKYDEHITVKIPKGSKSKVGIYAMSRILFDDLDY